MIERKNFIDNFNYLFKQNDNYYHFCIDINYHDNNDENINKSILVFFEDFLKNLNPSLSSSDLHEIFSTLNIQKQFDYDYVEENPENDLIRYWIKVNINELYDNFSKYLKPNITKIYRIESENGQGLYSIGKFACLNVGNNHPCPRADPLLNGIFNAHEFSNSFDNYYSKWKFGFDNLDDLRSWLGKEIANISFIIKEITISNHYVIRGNKQLIMKSEEIISEKNIYTTLDNTQYTKKTQTL